MNNSEDKKWLYGKLKDNGLSISYEDFENTLSNEDDRKWYYDKANSLGLQVGTLDEFTNLFYGNNKDTASLTQSNNNGTQVGSAAQQVIDEYDASVRMYGQGTPNTNQTPIQKRELPTLEARVNTPQFEPIENVQSQWAGDRNNADFIRSQKQRDLNNLYNQGAFESFSHREEETELDKRFTPRPVQDESDIARNYNDRFALTQRGQQLYNEYGKKQEEIRNKYLKEFEQSPEYQEIVSGRYTTQEEVDAANNRINELFMQRYGSQIDNDLKPYSNAINDEMLARYGRRIEEDFNALSKKNALSQLDDLKKDVEGIDSDIKKRVRSHSGTGTNAMNALMGSRQYMQISAKDRQEAGAMDAAKRLIEESEEIINEAKKKGNTNFVAGLLRGLRDNAFDAEQWVFGLAEMADNAYLLDALQKSERGEKLSPAEEKLLEASSVNMIVNAYYSQDLGRGYKAGQVTAQSLPFMLEFVVNPISASGSGIAKSLLKFGIKKFGKDAMKKNAVKAGARLLGDAAAAAGMTFTTGLPRVAAGTMERLAQDYNYGFDDNGNLKVEKVGDTSIGSALARSAASTFLENQSEMVFNAFRGASPLLKKADEVLPDGINGMFDKIRNSRVGQLYRELKNNPTFKELAERTQFRGIGEEYMEEVYNNFANIPLGEMTFEEAVDLDKNIDTFLGLAPTSIAFSMIGLGSLARERYTNRRRMNQLLGQMNEEQQRKFDELRQMSKQNGNADIAEFIKITLADETLTPEEKRAEIEYCYELAKQNAIDEVSEAETQDKIDAETQDIISNSDQQTQTYTECNRIITNDIGEIEQVPGYIVGYMGGQPLWKPEGADASVQPVALKEGEYDPASIQSAPTEQVIADTEQVIREEDAATQDRETRYSPDIVPPAVGSTYTDGTNTYEIVQPDMNGGWLASTIVTDDKGKDKEVVVNVSDQQYYDYKQAEIDRNEQQQTNNLSENQPQNESRPSSGESNVSAQPVNAAEMQIQSLREAGATEAVNATIESRVKEAKKAYDKAVKALNAPFKADIDVRQEIDARKKAVEEAKAAYNLWSQYAGQTEQVQQEEPAAQETTQETVVQQEEPVSQEQPEEVEQTETIPVDESGNILYHRVPVDVTMNEIAKYGLDAEETDAFVAANKEEAAKRLKSVNAKKPKVSTNLAQYNEAKKAWEEEMADAQAQVDYWNNVEQAYIDIRKRPGDEIAEQIMSNTEPMNGEEFAAQMLATGQLPLLRESYMKETGASATEAKQMFGLFRSKEKGGMTIERAGEVLMLADLENGTNFFDQEDANAGRNAIIEVLSKARTRGDLTNYIANNRRLLAEREREAEYNQYYNFTMNEFGMTPEEYEAYQDYRQQINPYEGIDINELSAIFAEAAREYEQYLNSTNNERRTEETARRDIQQDTVNEQAGETGIREEGTPVLPETQPVLQSEERTGITDERPAEVSTGSNIEDGTAQESTPGSRVIPGESIFDAAERAIKEKDIADARAEVNTNPTEGQKEAGNYKKGHVTIDGLDVAIENPKGSQRTGTDANGKQWSITMQNDYGYIRGTKAVDGDHIDIFLSDNPTTGNVFVVDAIDQETGEFDESKVMYGFESADAAREAYLSNYEEGWKVGTITEVSKEEFKKWIDSSTRKGKPFSEYKSVKEIGAQNEQRQLSIEEIENSPVSDVFKDGAKAYINGNVNFATTIAYQTVYNNVRNQPRSNQSDSQRTGTTQLDGSTDVAGSRPVRPSGSETNQVDREGSRENVSGQGVRGEDSVYSPAVPDGERSNNEVRGEESTVDGLSTGRSNTGRSRKSGGDGNTVRAKRGRKSSKPADGENTKRRDNSKSERDIALDEISNLLDEFVKAGKEGLSLSVVGMNPKQIEIAGKILVAGVKLGYTYIKDGIYKFSDWSKAMREKLATPFSQAMKLTNAEIDEFIKDMWEYPHTIDGQTKLLKEWAAEMDKQELRDNVRMTLEEKRRLQQEAEGIPVEVGNMQNIVETLPYLLPQQQEDVFKAERQFFDESHNDREHAFGKGYLFTNGTGTGKTYTGLGIVKRFIKQGKGRILILTPSQPKITDWVKDASNLGISLTPLESTQDKGEGAVITTFANLRTNKALMEDAFDLIVYDESHRIMENKQGEETIGAMQHYMLSNKNEQQALNRLEVNDPFFIDWKEKEARLSQLSDDIYYYEKKYNENNADTEAYAKAEKLKEERDKLNAEVLELRKRIPEEEDRLRPEAQEAVKRTKVVFLSATPFNTIPSLAYAEGYIFSYPEENKETVGRYTHRSPREEFLEKNFGAGYRFRYGRIENSIENPEALSRQEVQFSDYLENQLQTKSGRVIDSEYDYSRDFPTVTLNIAPLFNAALEDVFNYENKEFHPLADAFREIFYDYNYSTALFETMKIAAITPRIKQHLAMGRKVVIFHRRKESKYPITPPFATALMSAEQMAKDIIPNSEENKEKKKALLNAIKAFKTRYARLLDYEQTLDYSMPREQIAKTFGADNVLYFSGSESKKVKDKAIEQFNEDNSGKDIIVIQEASGKEGISLHDTTGNKQRVLITLALPQSPITALQIEGRIYRIGNKSNAIFEYPLLGLNLETTLFGQKFNQQVSTTENLALGSKARNLRTSFAEGVLQNSGDIPLEGQGVGGREFDNAGKEEQDGYDQAVLDYYGNQKLKGKRDQRAGIDYFPTPEPIGYKMVEWAQLQEGEDVLEPSAGHGAIARYVPRDNGLTAIEPSRELFSTLQLRAGGTGRKFVDNMFEQYNIVNKHDVVLMNPPYGTAGATAMRHVAKAFDHLNEGGRLIAIIPRGAADLKFEMWLAGTKNAAFVGEILLPSVTFNRAGTSVSTRIVVVDKVTRDEAREKLPRFVIIDLAYVNKIENDGGLFDVLRNIEMPRRTIDQTAIDIKNAKKTSKEIRDLKPINYVFIDGNGVEISGKGAKYNETLSFVNLKRPAKYAEYVRAYERSLKNNGKQAEEYSMFLESILKIFRNVSQKTHEQLMNEYNSAKAATSQTVSSQQQKSNTNAHYSYKLDTNTSTGAEMHLAVPSEQGSLSNEEYKAISAIARSNRGYWNRFKKAFHFPSKEEAERFIQEEQSIVRFREEYETAGISSQRKEDISNSISELSSQLNTPIRIANTLEEVTNASARRAIESGRNIKAWFEPSTGEVVVYMPNAESVEDATRSVLHEVVAHRGLRQLIGEDRYDEEMGRLYELLPDAERIKVAEQAASRYDFDIAVSMDEYLAEQAELDELPSWWDKVVAAARDMLRSIGINVRLTNGDVRYLLWRSRKNLETGNIMDVAEDVAMRDKAGILPDNVYREIDYNEQEIQSIIDKAKADGTYMKAPNGNPTNLTERQWAQVRTTAFKNWFGDWENDPDNASKVVDENGEPMVVYHGTDSDFNSFDIQRLGENTDFNASDENWAKTSHIGFWFNTNKIEFYSIHKPVFLNAKRTLVFSSMSELADEMSYYNSGESFREQNSDNYDSIIVNNDEEMRGTSYSVFNPSQIKSATENTGSFDPENPDIRFRESVNYTPNQATKTQQEYDRKLSSQTYKAQEAFQDSMLSLKILQDLVEQESGTKIQSFENAYDAENRMSSISQREKEVYMRDFYKPLTKAVADLVSKGASYTGVQEYVIAKHGLERNEVFARRDAEYAANEMYNAGKRDLDRALKNGTINQSEYDAKLQDLEDKKEELYNKEYEKNRKRDYSGLTQLTGEEKDYEQAAQEIVDEFESNYDTTDLWQKINAATNDSLRKTYESGIISRDMYNQLKARFKYYVPLRGWKDTTTDEVYEYMVDSKVSINPVIKKASGRKSLADDPFATIGNMAETAIHQGNRNIMKQHFLNMAMNHESSLLSVQKAWYVLNDENKWVLSVPNIVPGSTADEIADAVEAHEKRMKELEERGEATQVRSKLNVQYVIKNNQVKEHAVVVKRNGQEVVVFVNGNPRAAQAVNGLTNPNKKKHDYSRYWDQFNRFMSANFTTRNPAFVLTNLTRDLIFSSTAVAIKETPQYTARFVSNIGQSMAAIFRGLRGKENLSNETDRYFQEFLANGGETGYTNINTVEEYKKKLKREIKQLNNKTDYFKGVRAVADFFSMYNRMAEDVARFNTYMTSRQEGRTIAEAIRDAKEITVNFNRRGAGYNAGGAWGAAAGVMRQAYLFFNAAVQSLANFSKLYKAGRKAFLTTLAGFTTAGFLVPIINAFLMGDDGEDYYNNLPEWTRRNNICIYIGGGDFFTIPLPIELRAFYGLGELAYQATIGRDQYAIENVAYAALNQITELLPLNPLGHNGDIVTTVIPDAIKPFWYLNENETFTGSPIYKKNDFNTYDPEFKKAYRGISTTLVNLSKWLNEMTGGNNAEKGWIDKIHIHNFYVNNPAQVEELFNGFFGGMSTTILQTATTMQALAESALEGEKSKDLTLRSTPVLNRFATSGGDDRSMYRNINNLYYNYYDIYKEVSRKITNYKKEIQMGNKEYLDGLKELMQSDDYIIYQVYRSGMKDMRKINQAKGMLAEDAPELDELNKKDAELKKKIVDKVNELTEK